MKERSPSPYTPQDIERVFNDAYPLEILADKEEAERRIVADQAELDSGVSEDREAELTAQIELNREVLRQISVQLKRKLASYPTPQT